MRSVAWTLPVVTALFALSDCACSEPEEERPPCSTQEDCTGEELCIELPDRRVCGVTCGADNPCPSGQACVDEAGVLSCRELILDRELGQLCQSDRECLSGACVGPDEFGEFFCAAQCQADADCPDEEFCFLADHRRVCLRPLFPQIDAGAVCERGPRECSSRACVKIEEDDIAGYCVDQCTPEDGCTGERNCVQLPGGAHACIEYAPDGAECTSALVCENERCVRDDDDTQLCTRPCAGNDDCMADWVCVPTTEGDEVCMPIRDDAGGPGDTCSSRRDCTTGYCAHFNDDVNEPPTDFGTLCAEPCGQDGACDADTICWDLAEPDPDLCGPIPGQ